MTKVKSLSRLYVTLFWVARLRSVQVGDKNKIFICKGNKSNYIEMNYSEFLSNTKYLCLGIVIQGPIEDNNVYPTDWIMLFDREILVKVISEVPLHFSRSQSFGFTSRLIRYYLS